MHLWFGTTGLKSTYHSRDDNPANSEAELSPTEKNGLMKREGITVRMESDSSKGKVVNEAGESRGKYWKAGCAAR